MNAVREIMQLRGCPKCGGGPLVADSAEPEASYICWTCGRREYGMKRDGRIGDTPAVPTVSETLEADMAEYLITAAEALIDMFPESDCTAKMKRALARVYAVLETEGNKLARKV